MTLAEVQEGRACKNTKPPRASACEWNIITDIPFHRTKARVGGLKSHRAKGVGPASGRGIRANGEIYHSTFGRPAGLK